MTEDHIVPAILVQAEGAYKDAVANPAGAALHASALVGLAREAGDVEALVVALRAAAWAQRGLLAVSSAKRMLDEAVALATHHGLDARLGDVLLSRAAVLSELGQVAEAERDLTRAESKVSRAQRAEWRFQRATLLANIGRTGAAVRLLRAALADGSCEGDLRAKAANNLAYLEALRGHYRSAVRFAGEAETAAAAAGGPALLAAVTQTRAWVTMQEGRLVESIEMFGRAGDLYVKAGLPLGEHHLEYAQVLADLRLLPEALEAARGASEELSGARLMSAEAHLRVARLLLLTGDGPGARTAALRAAADLRRQGRTAWVARAMVVAHEAYARSRPLTARQVRSLEACARTLHEAGMVSDAVDAYLTAGRAAASRRRSVVADHAVEDLHAARQLARRASVLTRLKGRVAAALAAEVGGRADDVVRHSRAGLDDLARHRSALPSVELRALASGHGAELGTLGLRALVPIAGAARILAWMERTRAAALVSVESAPADGTDEDLATLRSLHLEMAAARRESDCEPAGLRTRISAAEGRIRRATWSGGGSASAEEAVGSARLRAALGDAVLVEFAILDDHLLAAVLDRRRVRCELLGPVASIAADVDALLFALRRLARPEVPAAAARGARAVAEDATRRLAGRLLGPLHLPPDGPLVVVPVGTLQRIPWSPLHAGPVSVAPSARFWLRSAEAAPAPDGTVVLLAGPQLPGAVEEVSALSQLHDSAVTMVPPASTCTAALTALAGSTLAHLACHGRVRADSPTFSSLLLSDGPLTVHELATRGVAPHRVVLAACDSGVQTTYDGDEALGFVSALLARGTAGLLASTVPVPDLDTVHIMRAVHRRLADGQSLANALHGARSTLDLDRPGLYASWCALNAYGAA